MFIEILNSCLEEPSASQDQNRDELAIKLCLEEYLKEGRTLAAEIPNELRKLLLDRAFDQVEVAMNFGIQELYQTLGSRYHRLTESYDGLSAALPPSDHFEGFTEFAKPRQAEFTGGQALCYDQVEAIRTLERMTPRATLKDVRCELELIRDLLDHVAKACFRMGGIPGIGNPKLEDLLGPLDDEDWGDPQEDGAENLSLVHDESALRELSEAARIEVHRLLAQEGDPIPFKSDSADWACDSDDGTEPTEPWGEAELDAEQDCRPWYEQDPLILG